MHKELSPISYELTNAKASLPFLRVILPAPASALCPASALPPPFTSFVKITSVMSWRERGEEGGSPGARGPGIPLAFVWALQSGEAGSPRAGQAACLLAAQGDHVGCKAWAGLGWQWPPPGERKAKITLSFWDQIQAYDGT